MDNQHKSNSGVKKRSSNACMRCRQQKIKCSGQLPCLQCSKRNLNCSFEDSTRKILVAHGYLRDLQRKADRLQSAGEVSGLSPPLIPVPEATGAAASQESGVDTWLGEVECTARQPALPILADNHELADNSGSSSSGTHLMNPLAVDSGNYMTDYNGRAFHLGTSSNWSFGRRVLSTACDRLGLQLRVDQMHFEGSVYHLDWHTLSGPPESIESSLPSSDHAIYLINALKFHCGQMFHMFDEEVFMQHFSTFHNKSDGVRNVPQLWYAHYLLVIGLGKTFVARNAQKDSPPGAELFVEAMRRWPDLVFSYSDPVESVEVLVCAAIYLQCLDFRSSAYSMIGQAVRRALEEGMHTQMSHQNLSNSFVQRCRRVWWTVYVLDRQMSALMGLPQAIRDEDITAPLPVLSNHQKSIGLELHVKLSRVIADMQNTVYSTEGRLPRKYLGSTKEALTRIAAVTDLLKQHIELPKGPNMGGISRLGAYLHLLNHQCICLTTRPLAFSFLDLKLESMAGNGKRLICPTGSARVLLRMCIESAQQMLLILSGLKSQGLLESFLPFDLESVFIAALILLMSKTIDTTLLEDHNSWLEIAYSVLEDMASRGNMIAVLRKRELEQLASVLSHAKTPAILNQQQAGYDGLATGHAKDDAMRSSSQHDMPKLPQGFGAGDMSDQTLASPYWQDEMTAEQLMVIADSLDLNGLDWMQSLEDASTRSPIL